jgi:hypothetical protein
MISAALPVMIYFGLIVAGLMATGQRMGDAVIQILAMEPRGYVFFLACFTLSACGALTLGWWLRRSVARSNHIDPGVFS